MGNDHFSTVSNPPPLNDKPLHIRFGIALSKLYLIFPRHPISASVHFQKIGGNSYFLLWEGLNKNITKFGGILQGGGGVYPFHQSY